MYPPVQRPEAPVPMPHNMRQPVGQRKYEQSPLEVASNQIRDYSVAHSVCRTTATSIAILLQEVIPQILKDNRDEAAVQPLLRAQQGLRTMLGEHLGLNTLKPDEESQQVRDAIALLTQLSKVPHATVVTEEYLAKLGATEQAISTEKVA